MPTANYSFYCKHCGLSITGTKSQIKIISAQHNIDRRRHGRCPNVVATDKSTITREDLASLVNNDWENKR